MEFDPLTFVAQIINFVILTALLNRFLFKPIKKTMDEREAKINKDIEAAEISRKEADKLAETTAGLKHAFEKDRETMMSLAASEAEMKKQELLRMAKEDAQKARQAWMRDLEDEKDGFLSGLKSRGIQYVCALAEKIVKDLGDEELEGRIAAVFVRRLKELDLAEKARLGASIMSEKMPPCVVSSFELGDATRRKLRDAIKDHLEYHGEIVFEIQQGLCGIELKTDGYTLAWNIRDYLDEFEERLTRVFEGKAYPEPGKG